MVFVMKRLSYTSIIIVLAVVTFLSYGNALFNQFVWDDGYLIVENPYIKNFKFIPRLFTGDLIASTAEAHKESGYYRPLPMLSFMVDYGFWGLNPKGFHFTNIVIHLLNSILVFFIAVAVSRNKLIGLITGLIFAVHPIHVEAVAPVYNRMGMMAAFCMFLSLLFFIRSQGLTKIQFAAGSLIMFCFGLLSKENAIIIPVILAWYDYCYLSDFKIGKLLERRKAFFYLSCVAICIFYLYVRSINVSRQIPSLFFTADGTKMPALAGNTLFHILTALTIVKDYIIKVLFPFNLSAVYWINPVDRLVSVDVLLGIAVVLGVVLLAYFLRKKYKDISFFIVLFLIGILPYSNIIPIGESYAFRERFLYFSSVSACFLIALLIYHLAMKLQRGKDGKTLFIISLAVVASLGVFTAISNYTWRTDLSLWRRTVKDKPQSQLAHLNLGHAYVASGRLEEALEEFKRSIEAPPIKAYDSIYLAKLGMASILIEFDRYDEALTEATRALAIADKINLNPFAAYDKLGLVYVRMGDSVRAEQNFKKAIKNNGNFLPSHYNVGVLYYENGNHDDAQRHLSYAYELDRDFIVAGYALGLTYVAQDKRQEAEKVFKEILKINPRFMPAKRYLERIGGK